MVSVFGWFLYMVEDIDGAIKQLAKYFKSHLQMEVVLIKLYTQCLEKNTNKFIVARITNIPPTIA